VTFLWPEAFVLLLAVPAFLWLYYRLERQRRSAADRHATLYAHASGLAGQRPYARHVPLMLFLASITALTIALARPNAQLTMFAIKGTVVLALDASTSMKANDAQPNRLAQSQAQAREFVAKYADQLGIGLVLFSGNAVAELDPSSDREALFGAIDRLTAQPGTAIGSGILRALSMIFPQADIDTLAWNAGHDATGPDARPEAAGRPKRGGAAPGSYSAAAIILFSDGQSGTGPDPMDAARLAARLGVRIHTVGIGSIEGHRLRFEGWNMRVQLDDAVLKEIATLTHGEYFHASTGIDSTRIVDAIRPQPPPVANDTELTAVFAAAAALAAAAAAISSLHATKRIL